MSLNIKIFFAVLILIAIFIGAWLWYSSLPQYNQTQPNSTNKAAYKATYLCKDNKTIDAVYYKGKLVPVKPGEPPVPTGSVDLVLSDGRHLTLPQTISASGVRYANSDESIIFWNKGNGAFILENNILTYTDCVAIAPNSGDLPQVYARFAPIEANSAGFSIRYPKGYSVNISYKYQELGPGQDISGIKFIIPKEMATGTNLSSFDTGVSVEQIPNTQNCDATLFVYLGTKAINLTDNNTEYSFASTTGAGAGNFYEEEVWAIPGTNPCIAIRYFIHSTNIYNYTPDTVKEFDRQNLINQFDKIRRSLILL